MEQPSANRALRPVERLARVADEAFTLNFVTSALVEGSIPTAAIRASLDVLAVRHPLLGAALDGDRFRGGAASPILLEETAARESEVDRFVERELRHRRWEGTGPRVRCLVLRHEGDRTTLTLTLHHVVSDGSSGVLAMRDLLRGIATPDSSGAPLDSPGQDVFYPAGRGGTADMLRSLAYQSRQMAKPKPLRIKRGPAAPPDDRVTRITRSRFSREQSGALARFAKASGATVHGVLTAALAMAIVDEANVDGAAPVRVMHPVDMRRYLATLPGSRPVGDAIGYYVSSVETDHRVERGTSLATLAAEVTRGVRAAKERGEPFLTAPTGGRLLVLARSLLGEERFLDVAERQLVAGTFAITNLGPLENLGLETTYGPLRVRAFGFVASPSIFGSLCASASSFDGELEFVLHHVEPRIDAETAARIAARVAASFDLAASHPEGTTA